MANFDVPFVDKNAERHVLSKRIGKIIDHIADTYLYPASEPTGNFEYRDGQSTIEQLHEGQWRKYESETEFWGYPECYCWFRQTITVPQRFAGQPVVYEALPHDSGWRETNPQLILFANGKLLQGMDSNHRQVLLLDSAKGGEVFEIALNAYTDPFAWKGPVRMRARLRTVSTLAKDLYFDLKTPLETANCYEADDLPRVKLLRALNAACNLLEMSDENDVAAFEASAKEAIAYLEQEIYSGEQSEILASCIGHTHIDVAWLWRLRQTRDKAGRSFATVLKYMEEYPEYKFMSSQAQLYDYVKQDYPEVYEGIKQRIAEGRWEAEGSMWVESDTNVISGESLVRQFLVGKRFFRQEFGIDNKIMWLPDVFGYSGALPQIIKKSGIDYFMTTKISWNEYDKVPFDTFLWQGIDGTEVLAHFSTGADAIQGRIPSHFTTYNAFLAPDQVIGGWRRYSNKDLNSEYLITFGYGDGGGGPTTEMLEHSRRMNKGVAGCPKVIQQPSLDFFRDLEAQVTGDDHLPTWRGELYLEFHRGTLTAQARNKRFNRKSELLFHDAETLAALALQYAGTAYPAEQILENWKLILLNQFHDIIPGSSIKEVYEDSKEQYLQVLAEGEDLALAAMQTLAAQIGGCGRVVVFNTLGFARDDVAFAALPELPAGQRPVLRDADGSELPSQITHDGKLCFLAKGVPAKGWKSFGLSLTGEPAPAFAAIDATGNVVENDALRVTFDDDYNIAELLHKATGRTVAPAGEILGRLVAFEDRPFNHDAWDIKAYYREKSWDIDDVQSATVVEAGPVRTVLRVVRKYLQSTIQQDYIFAPSSERIDVEYYLDWKERNIALKADYPVEVNTGRATYDIQFGNIERTTHENTTWDYAQFEACGHKWADLSDNGFGLSVLNDCKYGWTIKGNRILPTLLRCATGPNVDQDREEHRFTYSIYPHAGAVSESNVAQEGYSLNVPLRTIVAEPGEGALPATFGLVSADAGNIIIETVKKAEDSDALVIRFYETWNRRTETTLRFGSALAAAAECDLMEENDSPLPFTGNELPLVFKPFELKTVKVVLA
ncbi:MAG: glycosyl hydrolase-related protein [Oscillospiraceae bacterium]|jgi:alpha-mannosidase|nr:glycosyl hydrolase-related protein [Oscillospiraceae bacterium]